MHFMHVFISIFFLHVSGLTVLFAHFISLRIHSTIKPYALARFCRQKVMIAKTKSFEGNFRLVNKSDRRWEGKSTLNNTADGSIVIIEKIT